MSSIFPKSIEDSGLLASPDGAIVPLKALEGKTILLYFSAHWCPPCRQFTPMLISFYKQLRLQRGDFEIVFMSRDKDEVIVCSSFWVV